MNAVSIVPLTDDLREGAFALATKVFIADSTLHRALGIGLAEYHDYLRPSFDAVVAEGLSMAAMDTQDGRLAGCLIATDFATASSVPVPVRVPERFAPLAALTTALCQQVAPTPPGQAVLVDMGAVLPQYCGQGVYRRLRIAMQDNARECGFRTVFGELSSAATQHVILNRLGHNKLAQIAFASFEYHGEYPFAKITDPPGIVLAAGTL